MKTLFGSLVRVKRTELRMTQADLAEAADLSLDMVSRLERGTVGPSLETIVVMSEILKVPTSVLLGGAPLEGSGDGQRESVLLRIHQLLAEIATDDLPWIETVIGAIIRKQPK